MLPSLDLPMTAFLDATPDGVLVVDLQGRILLVNAAAERLFATAPATVVGRSIEDLLPERLHAAHRDHRAAYVDAPRQRPMGVGLELWGRQQDGTEFPVEVSLSPLQTAEGLLVLAYVRDISARARQEAERAQLLNEAQEARDQLERLMSITDVALAHLGLDDLLNELLDRIQQTLQVDAIMLLRLDPDAGVMVPWAARGLLTAELATGVPIPLGQGYAGRVAAERRTIMVTDLDQTEVHSPVLRSQGLHALLGTPLVLRDQVVGVLHVSTRAARPFSAADTDLLERVAARIALAIDNAVLYQQATEAIQAREAFLATAAHELKTPLTTVKGWIYLLATALTTESKQDPLELASYALELKEQIDGFEVLIEDLLDTARLQQNRLELRPEPLDLVALTRRVLHRFEHAPERRPEHSLTLAAPPLATGVWDPDRLEQVLTNLVSNALKYSPDGGEVQVTLGVEPEIVTLAVRDHGIGVSPEDQLTLFEPFTRTTAGRQAANGSGLGLHIVRQLVAQHQGTLELDSDIGAGSTFTIRLPRYVPGY